ncbi:hypothetical protein BIY24_02050 [Halobacteriovorax marinus]|nr:hypothetical protein BIY24_02050 [Halobacteriovorax marinus]
MGIKKLQNLFTNKKVKEQKKPALSLAKPESKSNTSTPSSDSAKDKAEIEAYIKSINSKLKEADMAKKAAQILENWTKKN